MSDTNSHLSRQSTPSKLLQAPSKSQITTWLSSFQSPFASPPSIESLGDGALYCKILNHYIPNTILTSRILQQPINEYECCLNLKALQLGLAKNRVNVSFDIHRISKKRFHQNWNLAVAMYRVFEGMEPRKNGHEDSSTTKKRLPLQLSQPSPRRILQENPQKMNTPTQSKLFQTFPKGSLVCMIDRVKQILISDSNNSYKVELISQLFGVDDKVKIEEKEEAEEHSDKKENKKQE